MTIISTYKDNELSEKSFLKSLVERISFFLLNKNIKKLQLIEEVKSLLAPGFSNGESGVIIPRQRVNNVLNIVKQWPEFIKVPYLDIDEDGELYLSLYNNKGLIVVGLLFNGDQNMFAYSIDNGKENPDRGEIDAQDSEDVSNFFDKLTKLIGKIS